MRDFRKLDVWLKAHQLTVLLYRATVGFPQSELYGLVVQIRRAAVSIEANLAEGCGRETDIDKRRFVHIASGSASELECLLQVARDLGYLENSDYLALNEQAVDVKKMLYGLAQILGKES